MIYYRLKSTLTKLKSDIGHDFTRLLVKHYRTVTVMFQLTDRTLIFADINKIIQTDEANSDNV